MTEKNQTTLADDKAAKNKADKEKKEKQRKKIFGILDRLAHPIESLKVISDANKQKKDAVKKTKANIKSIGEAAKKKKEQEIDAFTDRADRGTGPSGSTLASATKPFAVYVAGVKARKDIKKQIPKKFR